MVKASAPESAYFSVNTLLSTDNRPWPDISQRMTIELEVETFEKWRLDGRTFNPKKHPHIDYLRKQLPPIEEQPIHIRIRGSIPKASGTGNLRCIVGGTLWSTATTSW